MNILVTGGAGFIGTHLVLDLLRQGHNVTVYDKRSPHEANWTLKHRLVLQNNPKDDFKWVTGDILDLTKLEVHVARNDMVYHLAANTDIPNGHKDCDLDLKNCVEGTRNVLEAMRRSSRCHEIVYASTAAAYGNAGAKKAVSEATGHLCPISLYGAGKLAAESFVSAYAEMFAMYATIFRFGNVVGGNMDHGVIMDTITKVRTAMQSHNEVFEVWGNGFGFKPFFLVDDCVHGIQTLHRARLESPGPISRCEIFNLGTETTSVIKNVVAIVMEEMDPKRTMTAVYQMTETGFVGDVPRVLFNVDKAKSWGWKANYTSDVAVRIATRRLLRGVLKEG